MFKLYLVLCILQIVAFYYLVWTVATTSATYLVEKNEIEGRTKHLIKNKKVSLVVISGVLMIVGNLGISKFGEKVYADEEAKEESISKLDYEKNFTQKHYKIDPDRKSRFCAS